MKFKDDVIVIGSGIGGLSCAASLSKKGYKVHIYERLNQPGGYVNTFKRGKYWFEASTHQLVGFNNNLYLKKELEELGLKLEFIKLKDSFESIQFDEKYNILKRFYIKSGKNNAYKSLINYFNNEKKSINDFFIKCEKICKESFILRKIQNKKMGANFVDVLMALLLKNKKIFPLLRKPGLMYYKYFLNYRNKSFNDLINVFKSNDLKFLLSLYCYYFIQSSPKNISAVTMSHLIYNLIITPPLFLKGGTRIMINECLDIIKRNNSIINYNSYIREIILKNGKAVGVELVTGEKKYANIIISNSDAYITYKKMIKQQNYDDKLIEKLKNYKSTKSAFQIYIGFPFSLEKYGYNASTIFFNNSNDIEDLFNNNCKCIEKNNFALTNYTAMDKEFSPPDKSSLMITEFDTDYNFWKKLSRKQYKLEKEKKQNKIINKVQKITGIPLNEAEIVFSATPLTMEYYSGRNTGSIYGVEKSMDDISKFDNKSCINSLYLVGADTGNSGSITSAFYSGIKTADEIIKQNK